MDCMEDTPMPTSSDYETPTPQPDHDHWSDLTATLSEESRQIFSDWMGQELEDLVEDLSGFETPNSLRKSLRR